MPLDLPQPVAMYLAAGRRKTQTCWPASLRRMPMCTTKPATMTGLRPSSPGNGRQRRRYSVRAGATCRVRPRSDHHGPVPSKRHVPGQSGRGRLHVHARQGPDYLPGDSLAPQRPSLSPAFLLAFASPVATLLVLLGLTLAYDFPYLG